MRIQRLVLILTVLMTSFSAQAFLKCQQGDTETVTMANDIHESMVRLHKARAVSRAEVLRAKVFLLEAQLCSAQIEEKRFCELAVPVVRELISFGDKEIGYPSLENRREYITLFAEAKMLCEK